MFASKPPKNKPTQSGSQDPLYSIFESHLYNFQDSEIDRKTFIAEVIKAYLTHLRKMTVSVPRQYEPHVIEELTVQVNAMLVKKIYGCLSIEEFRQKAKAIQKPKRTSGRTARLRTGSD